MNFKFKNQVISNVSIEKVKKAKLKEKAIHLIERKGIKIEKAFKKFGLKISPFSYLRIYNNYKERGIEGLIDKRHGNPKEKITLKIKEYIILQNKQDNKLSAKQIRKIILEEFDVKLHVSSITNILREAGLSIGKGRPRKEIKEIAIDHAGGFLIKGALIIMGLIKVIVDRIQKGVSKIRRQGKSDFDWMEVLTASRKVLHSKVESLLYMPIFQMERIYHFKRVYPRDGLGPLERKETTI